MVSEGDGEVYMKTGMGEWDVTTHKDGMYMVYCACSSDHRVYSVQGAEVSA